MKQPALFTPCVLAAGATNRDGYVQKSVGGKTALAHRLAWERVHGPIPSGLVVRHLCHNPRCINVEHLTLGTHADNVRDRDLMGHTARGERHGRAKLDARAVQTILGSTLSPAELARQFGVSHKTIRNIRAGKLWRHLSTAQSGPGR